jgi:drug/metabolite transporter, DME family
MLAAASGLGFGLFQSVNVRALRRTQDPFASTLVQVSIAALALVVVAGASGDLADALDAPLWALGDFAAAGLLHFLAGWSLLNLSQQRIGAARTSPLLTTVPVFGVVIALVSVGQRPSALAVGGIAVMCAGAWLVATRRVTTGGGSRLGDALPGLGCAFLWALSPVFTVHGLEGFDSPLAGLAIGLLVSVAMYLPAYALWRGAAEARRAVVASAAGWKLLAGALVALSTWWRWAALEGAEVGVVLALSLLSVPVVLLVAPRLAGRGAERVEAGVWGGAGLVVAGALVLLVA